MGRIFSMTWRQDGSVKLSKHAPKELHELVATGQLNQGPLPKRRARLPRALKPATDTSVNEYGVTKDQIWESLDPRDFVDGQQRQVRILLVGDDKALVENLRNGKQTAVALKRFCGKTNKGFKLLAPALKSSPMQVEA